MPEAVTTALSNDLNAPLALAELFALYKDKKLPELKAAMEFLGFPAAEKSVTLKIPIITGEGWLLFEHSKLGHLVSEMQRLRSIRDYAASDNIRRKLVDVGLVVKLGKGVPQGDEGPDFNAGKLEKLLDDL